MNRSWKNFFDTVRKNSQVICGMGLGVMFTITYLPEGCFPHFMTPFYQLYENGLPVYLDKHSEMLKEEVLDSVRLKPVAEVDVLVLPTSNADPIHKGSTRLRGGTMIGLPANFRYRSVDDVEKHRLLAGGKSPDWSKPATNSLANSLVLSDDAKKFVIAREIGYVDTWHTMNRPLLTCTAFTLSYSTGFFFNEVYNLRRRLPLRFRMFLYAIWGTVGLGFYVLTMDSYLCHLDRHSDKYACKLGLQYVDGGVEYYRKLLERNRALRELLPKGSNYYTLYGNLVSTWRQKSLPITQRLDNIKLELEKLNAAVDEALEAKPEEECTYCK